MAEVVPPTEIAPFDEVTSLMIAFAPNEILPVVEIASFAVIVPFTSREANLFTEPTDFSKVTFVVFALFPIVKA